jgi:hypothetical protein
MRCIEFLPIFLLGNPNFGIGILISRFFNSRIQEKNSNRNLRNQKRNRNSASNGGPRNRNQKLEFPTKGGSFSSHGSLGQGCKAPPQSFGLVPNSTTLATMNAVHQSQVQSGLYVEMEHCKLRVCSQSERDKMEDNSAAA